MELSLDDLGDQLCELSAHIAAAQYRWLLLLAEFDRRNGWAHWGCRSCAHWLNWRCGLDLRSAREKVRVARALEDLPLMCEAFSRGEVSYSKVRAMTRIATPETEADLLTFARHGTTQHVEKIVRGNRRCLPAGAAEIRHERRYVNWSYAEDGSIVIKARLDPEEGAMFVRALESVQDDVRASGGRRNSAMTVQLNRVSTARTRWSRWPDVASHQALGPRGARRRCRTWFRCAGSTTACSTRGVSASTATSHSGRSEAT